MPIYEYRCQSCKRKFSMLNRSFSEIKEPLCTHCGTSKRVFREALDWSAAVQEILLAMGSRFDPDILEAFEKVVPSLKTIGGETRSGSA